VRNICQGWIGKGTKWVVENKIGRKGHMSRKGGVRNLERSSNFTRFRVTLEKGYSIGRGKEKQPEQAVRRRANEKQWSYLERELGGRAGKTIISSANE